MTVFLHEHPLFNIRMIKLSFKITTGLKKNIKKRAHSNYLQTDLFPIICFKIVFKQKNICFVWVVFNWL